MKNMKKTLLVALFCLVATGIVAAAGFSCSAKDTNSCCAPAGKGASSECEAYKPTSVADTLEVFSDKMHRAIKNTVILPEQYLSEGDTATYPVVYLLHGASGCYRDWPRVPAVKEEATRLGIVIVCPDGQDSWYFDSPVDSTMQFETYITQELRRVVEQRYRVRTGPRYTAISGLSMGGHGALWLGFRHPELYGSCGSMSGGGDFTAYRKAWHIAERLGPYEENPARWASHTVVSLVPTLEPGQNIIIDDGDADFFYDVNIELHYALVAHKIDHRFDIRPGAHTWTYWAQSVVYHLEFFDECFRGLKPATGTTILPKAEAQKKAA